MTHALQQTHWVNRKHPAAVPPGMEHALIIGSADPDEPVHVTTIDSLVTRSYPPAVDPISPDETPAVIRATDEDIATAAQYEQNIRELIEWSSRSDIP